MRFSTGVALAALLASCDTGAGQGPSLSLTDLPAQVTLAVGESRIVGGALIRFAAVRSDSRCPIDAVCVWAGNAELELAVSPVAGDGPTHRLLLNTGVEPKSGSALGLGLAVVGLAPAPSSSEPTRNYRVELRVSRAP